MSASTGGLCRKYFFTREQLNSIPTVHGLDALTRIQMRLASLDVLAKVQAPGLNDYCINEKIMDFVWIYTIQRRVEVSWAEAEVIIGNALSNFFRTFATT